MANTYLYRSGSVGWIYMKIKRGVGIGVDGDCHNSIIYSVFHVLIYEDDDVFIVTGWCLVLLKL
jgi:hypothetical protein